ncbi:DUF4190 domain-containing protein [Micromonospora sp. NPDC126480]|uniref:DUF4190 domain-containing protein n=1 Tax=Micromonospora sp. NPDC126480 TaxID=3155312 RepID=UPI00332C63B6
MSYPPPSGGWQDPAWSGQQSSPPADPTLPVSGQPIPAQPTGGDPYAPANPYAGAPTSPYQDPYAGQKLAPGQPAPDPYAAGGYPQPVYPGYGYPPAPQTNGMAVASMVVSIMGVMGICGYGIGGIIGVVGAILGHVAKRQIRERGEAGEGMANAGIIMGWISTAIALIAAVAIIGLIIFAANQDASATY